MLNAERTSSIHTGNAQKNIMEVELIFVLQLG
jgi:hypothetical protein